MAPARRIETAEVKTKTKTKPQGRGGHTSCISLLSRVPDLSSFRPRRSCRTSFRSLQLRSAGGLKVLCCGFKKAYLPWSPLSTRQALQNLRACACVPQTGVGEGEGG